MKKRLAAAGLIFFLLTAVCLWGSRTMRDSAFQLESRLNTIEALARQGLWADTAAAARQAKILLRQNQSMLCWFVPHELTAELDECFCTLPPLADQQDPALFVETERARSKLRALTVLFFRPL